MKEAAGTKTEKRLESLAAGCLEVAMPRTKHWITCDEASEEFGWSKATLREWGYSGIPLLRRQKLRTKSAYLDGKGRKRMLFYRPTLVQLQTAISRSREEWATAKELRAEVGISEKTLDRWCRNGITGLRGHKLGTKKSYTEPPERRLARLYHRPTVRKAVELLRQGNGTGKWRTATQLAEELHCNRTLIYQFHRRGIPALGHRKLPGRMMDIVLPGRYQLTWRRAMCFDLEMARQGVEAERHKAAPPPGALTVRDTAVLWEVDVNAVRGAIRDGRLKECRCRSQVRGKSFISYVLDPPATYPLPQRHQRKPPADKKAPVALNGPLETAVDDDGTVWATIRYFWEEYGIPTYRLAPKKNVRKLNRCLPKGETIGQGRRIVTTEFRGAVVRRSREVLEKDKVLKAWKERAKRGKFIDRPYDARNQWMIEQHKEGATWDEVFVRLKPIARQNGWPPLLSASGCLTACQRFMARGGAAPQNGQPATAPAEHRQNAFVSDNEPPKRTAEAKSQWPPDAALHLQSGMVAWRGETKRLRGRLHALLSALHDANAPVTRRQLIDSVWSDAVVVENNVNVHVNKLRVFLRDLMGKPSAFNPIETLDHRAQTAWQLCPELRR
jgi:hypothetical protein